MPRARFSCGTLTRISPGCIAPLQTGQGRRRGAKASGLWLWAGSRIPEDTSDCQARSRNRRADLGRAGGGCTAQGRRRDTGGHTVRRKPMGAPQAHGSAATPWVSGLLPATGTEHDASYRNQRLTSENAPFCTTVGWREILCEVRRVKSQLLATFPRNTRSYH